MSGNNGRNDVAAVVDTESDAEVFEAFLAAVGREDLRPEEVPGLIEDAADRLGLDDVDPLAVAGNRAPHDVIAALVAVIDFPPPRVGLEMPEQAIGACAREGSSGLWRGRFGKRT